jgi:natural product precursor
MKKQIKKLSISKKTISNFNSREMNQIIGGAFTLTCYYHTCGCGNKSNNCTQNQNTCPGHNTCYTC